MPPRNKIADPVRQSFVVERETLDEANALGVVISEAAREGIIAAIENKKRYNEFLARAARE